MISADLNAPQILQVRRPFSLLCRVEVNIRSSARRIWTLLTDAKGFHRWNSTVTAIEGEIRDGERLRIRVADLKREAERTAVDTTLAVIRKL